MKRGYSGLWPVLIIMAFIAFFHLGVVPLLDPDEPVYAQTPKEMLSFADLISPRIFGEYWYDKPPMYYWLVAASFQLFGVNEFAARFPSALLSVACAGVVYAAGARLFSPRAGLAGALVLATSVEYFYLAKAAVTDITLTFFLTLSLLAFLMKRYYLFYAAAALATVTKGPIGLVFPGAILFLYFLFSGRWDELKRMHIPAGFVIYCVLALPWYIAMYQLHGAAFVDTFLGFHNLTRFTQPEHPEGALWYYFIPVLIAGFFPWTALLVQSVWNSLRSSGREYGILLFLNIWSAFIFVFFSISQTKLVSYILPMFPPLAMVIGWHLDRMWVWNYRPGKMRVVWPLSLTVLSGALIAGSFVGLNTLPELQTGVYALSVVLALMTAAVWYYTKNYRPQRAFWSQVAGMVLFFVILLGLLFPAAAPQFTSKIIAQDFLAQYDRQSPVYIIKFLRPGFAYYSGVYGQEVTIPGQLPQIMDQNRNRKAFYVLRQSDYNGLPETYRQRLHILAESADKMLLMTE